MISRFASLARLVLVASALVAGGIALSACSGGGVDFPQCEDGLDNDGDGLIDEQDPACAAGSESESDDPPVACNDGVDNDGDGRIDHPDDPGCEGPRDTDEFNVRLPACMDQLDNDGDGASDFPNDPGCTTPNQDDESDDCPDGPNCPECGDGDDNDADGQSDFPADDGCGSASDPEEFMLDADACGVGTMVLPLPPNNAAAATLPANGPSNISSATCNGRGAEIAYLVTVPRRVTMVASTNSGGSLDTVLYVRQVCQQAATELACNDNISPTNNKSTITVDLDPGSYFLVVDSRDLTSGGSFQLSVIFYEGQGEECTGPANCAPGYVCRAVPPSTTTTCERPVCSDGRDDDGDTKIDFPLDPGCTDANDATEDDTCPGVGCPACGDGMDNDSDGNTDYPMDPSCIAASATSEADCPLETDPVTVITAATTTGNTTGAGNQFAGGTCQTFSTAPDRVHMLYVRSPLATLKVDTDDSAFDTILTIRDSTCATQIACDDDGGLPGAQSSITQTNVAVGAYAIVVDGFSSGAGAYNLHVAGTYNANAACDPATPWFACPAGFGCGGPVGMTTCIPAACNDMIDDDGDGAPGFPSDPGCTSTSDTDETDDCPSGPMCPACGNDLDDDGDGQIDYPMDLNCTSASTRSEDCATIDPLRIFTGNVVNQTTVGLANDIDLSCGPDGRDEVWRLRLLAPLSELRVNTIGSTMDTILAIKRGGCSTFDLQCDDNSAGNGDSSVFLVDADAGDYFIVVDDKGVAGTYNLNVSGLYADGAPCDPTSTIFACNPGSACIGTTPVCTPALCNDMLDDDGDGFNGFPTDPGCTSTSDNTETDDCPSGPGCPACSNDLDDDGDGFTDYPLDSACAAASTGSELAPCTTVDPVRIFAGDLTATTAGLNNDVDLSCGVDGRDEIYRLFIPRPLVSLTVDTIDSVTNTALAIRAATCNGTADLACGTNNAGVGDARVSLNNVAAGELFVIVDDLNVTTPMSYNLRIRGVIAAGASCDPASPTFLCTAGFACGGTVGAETCVTAACNDADDDDGAGDGVGYPTDPGCTSTSDNDESDDCPSGPGCPQCSDDIDNDTDGRIDYPMDLGCVAAGANSEVECQVETDPIIAVTMAASTGTTAGAANNFIPTCGSTFTTTAPDRVHLLNVQVPLATLHIDTELTVFDTTLSLSDANCSATIVCDDQGGVSGNSSAIDRTNVTPGAYAIVVDGFSSGQGAYNLNVRGTIAPNGSCEDPLVAAGVFTCGSGSACAGPAGMRTCVPAACNDTVDADGDGFNGFPTDPGCDSVSDNDETDDCPSGPGCPDCSDGVDNDADTRIDYPLDPGCTAASSTSEAECQIETDPITPITTPITTGNTTGAANNFTSTCGSTFSPTSPDRVHFLTLAVPVATLVLDTENSGFDTTLTLSDATCGPVIECDDDDGVTGNNSFISRTNVAAGVYALIVDGFSTGFGAYILNVRGTIASGASCNDPLVAAGVLTCAAGTSCQAGVCSP